MQGGALGADLAKQNDKLVHGEHVVDRAQRAIRPSAGALRRHEVLEQVIEIRRDGPEVLADDLRLAGRCQVPEAPADERVDHVHEPVVTASPAQLAFVVDAVRAIVVNARNTRLAVRAYDPRLLERGPGVVVNSLELVVPPAVLANVVDTVDAIVVDASLACLLVRSRCPRIPERGDDLE